MDREALVKKMKEMKSKARKSRAEGKKQAADAFKSGMKRLRRHIKLLTPKTHKKKSDEG